MADHAVVGDDAHSPHGVTAACQPLPAWRSLGGLEHLGEELCSCLLFPTLATNEADENIEVESDE